MMKIILKNQTFDQKPLQATFLPLQGMTLSSYRIGDLEMIDQSTKADFEDHFGGLGVIIGPHFHHLPDSLLHPIPHEELFPHIARVRKKGKKDPFSHGIARYAPWDFSADENSIQGTLTGDSLWNDISLKELEGEDFTMHFSAHLSPQGLEVALDVQGERSSIVGFHYYLSLYEGKGIITSNVGPEFNDLGTWKPIPKEWMQNGELHFDLSQGADYGFRPNEETHSGKIILENPRYRLTMTYSSPTDEHAWQLYHPEGSSFVCIEPVGAQNPRGITANSSAITALFSVEPR